MVKVTGRWACALGLALALMAAGGEAAYAQGVEPAPVPDPAAAAAHSSDGTDRPATPEPLPNERTIALKHHWTGEELTVLYRVGNGYLAEALAEINWLLRDYRCNQSTVMDPKLIDLIYELQHELKPKKPIRIVSAFRSEGYNASLLRAGRTVDPDSQHTQGKAADVIFPGVPPERVRAAAEARGLGGVGFYPFSGPVFVHIDTGPVRHWTERDPKISRAMGLSKRRGRLALDCSLTTEQALEQVSAEQAYAALPPGAASKPRPTSDVLHAGLAAQTASHSPVPGAPLSAPHISQPDGDGPACVGSTPLAELSLLPPRPARPVLAAAPVRRRIKSGAVRQKQRVKAQVKSARRAAARPKGKARASSQRRASATSEVPDSMP